MSRFRFFLILALAAGALLVPPPPASAGEYIVYSCKTRLNQRVSTDGWSPFQNVVNAHTVNDCARGGSLRATLRHDYVQPNGARATWKFAAAPDTEIRNFAVWRTAQTVRNAFDTYQTPAEYISWPSPNFHPDAHEWCAAFECEERGRLSDDILPENLWASGNLNGIRELHFSAGCVGMGDCSARSPTGYGAMAEIRIQGFEAHLIDATDPRVDRVRGALTGAGPHAGIETIGFDATDTGSGLYRTFIDTKAAGGDEWINRVKVPVDLNEDRCVDLEGLTGNEREFDHVLPCKLSVAEEASFDTRTIADGQYELRVRVEDASGNLATVHGAPFAIDNVPPPAMTTPPSIAGVPKKGNTLVGNRGTWTGAENTYANQWLRCDSATELASCQVIAGAEADQYKLVTEDLGRFIRFRVTARNADGSAMATTNPTGAVTNDAGVVPQCADGIDNDKDGKVDTADPACTSREGTDEAAETTVSGGFEHPLTSPVPGPAAPGGGGTITKPSGASNGTNASERARLTLTGSRHRTVGFGRRVETTVAVRDENGRPITGAIVAVLERMKVPEAEWVPAHAPLITDADGYLRYSAPPRFSRTVRFAYRSNLADPSFKAILDVAITVLSSTTLKTSESFLHNGDTLRFSGRLRSRPVPRAGVVIDLQAKVGQRWQTFNTVRTNSEGRWRASYRFRSTTGLQTYVFRARVRGDTGFPYAPSTSKRAKVRVRG